MYYKVIFDGSVIDALDSLQYVMQNKTNLGIVGTNDAKKAMGILSSDATKIWHVDMFDEFVTDDFDTVKLVEISEDEYNELREELDDGGDVPYDDPSEDEKQEPAAKTSLRVRIEKLEAKIDYISMMDGIELPDDEEV